MTDIGLALSPDRTSLQRRGRLWLLLGAALIALLAIHALSAHDAAGDHRTVSSSSAATSLAGGQQQAAGGDAVSAAVPGHGSSAALTGSPASDTHVIVAGCMFLLAAAAVAVFLVSRRQAPRRPAAVFTARSGGLRGPPKPLLRLALCVERI